MCRTTGLLFLFIVSALLPSAAWGVDEQVFALVVANNRSLDPKVEPLRYADDDGARFYELISAVARKSIVLAVLDEDSQRTYPHVADVSRTPTIVELRRAMRELRGAISTAREAGARTVFVVYFAGHGDVGVDREGFINLLDRRFSRSDLYREIIAQSPAQLNHVIIDACNSYYLVNRRGKGRVKAAISAFLSDESLERYPNTGVVLSTATQADTHEWARYRGGIFSHELISGLWGSADVSGDGRVSYPELSAYLDAANMQVRDVRARLRVFVRPPRAHADAPLIDLARLRWVGDERRPATGRIAAMLKVPESMHGHYYLEDDRGVRYLDFNKSAEQPLRLALLDRPYYHLRSTRDEALIRIDRPAEIDADTLSFAPLATRARGSVEQSFRRDLFAVPFGRSFAMGHTSGRRSGDRSRIQVVHVDPPASATTSDKSRIWRSSWIWGAAGLSIAALASGITLQVLSLRAGDDLESGVSKITMSEAVDLQDRRNTYQAVAGVSFGVAATAAAASLVLFLTDRTVDVHKTRSSAQIAMPKTLISTDGKRILLSTTF